MSKEQSDLNLFEHKAKQLYKHVRRVNNEIHVSSDGSNWMVYFGLNKDSFSEDESDTTANKLHSLHKPSNLGYCPECVGDITAQELRETLHDIIWPEVSIKLLGKDGYDRLDKVIELFDTYASQKAVAARDSTRRLYDRELAHAKAFQEAVVARDALKTNPSMVICDRCHSELTQESEAKS